MFANKGTFCSLLRQWCIKGLNQGTLHYYLFLTPTPSWNALRICPRIISTFYPTHTEGVFVTPFSCHHLMKALFLQLIFITIALWRLYIPLFLFVLTALHFYYPLFLATPFTSFTLVIMTCVHPLSVVRMVQDSNRFELAIHVFSAFCEWISSLDSLKLRKFTCARKGKKKLFFFNFLEVM